MSPSRRATRVPFEEEVRYWIGGQAYWSKARNISLSGIFLNTHSPAPQDTTVRMELQLCVGGERHRLHLRGKVYRIVDGETEPEQEPGMGVTFIGLDHHSHQLLSQICLERNAEPFWQLRRDRKIGPAHPEALGWQELVPLILLALLLGVLFYISWQVL